MMNIRVMRVRVRDGQVPVRMRMRFCPVPLEIMVMPMMVVVAVPMRMLERLVRMRVFMPLAQVQPDAGRHQRRRAPECRGGHVRP